jgi:hypothetical protein
VYDEPLGAAARLDMLRRLEGGGVDAHATATATRARRHDRIRVDAAGDAF